MMTTKEAIKSLENKRDKLCRGSFWSDEGEQMDCWGDCSDNGCELDMAIKALEKQVPKKPMEKNVSEYCVDWVCANCSRFHRTDGFLKYCSECGQKIDWSEEE